VSSTLPALGAALGAAFSWGLGSLLFARVLTRPRGPAATATPPSPTPPSPTAANLFKNILAVAGFALAALVLGTPWPAPGEWPAMMLSGLLGFALGDALFFAALERIGVQKTAMLAELNVPLTALVSCCVFGERFGVWTLAAIAVVLAGVTIVVRGSDPGIRHGALRAGILCACGAVLFQSAGALTGHASMEGQPVLSGTIVRVLGGVAGAFLVALLSGLVRGGVAAELGRLTAPLRERAGWPALALAALCSSLAGLPLYHYALRELDSGLAMVLFATTPLFTLPLGFFFGVRGSAAAWIGTLLGFAGVLGVVLAAA